MSAAIGGAANPLNQAQSRNAFAELSSEQFIKIMVEELSSQDPFAPNDSAAVLEQISSIRNIESQNKLETSLDSLILQNSVAQASSMIGKAVTGLNASNNEVTGLVTAIKIENGKPVLKLEGGQSLPFDRLTDIGDLGDMDNAIIQQLLNNLAILDSSNLVGKLVSGIDGNRVPVEGTVTSVRLEENGDITLELDTGQSMPIAGVRTFAGNSGGAV